MKKLWEGGKGEIDERVFRFTVGNDHTIDQRLLHYDVKGSEAHAKALAKIGILSQQELKEIRSVLKEITTQYEAGNIQLQAHDEDMHTFIEAKLTSRLGKTGGKIHTGRSRNDQVLTALRLFSRDELSQIIQQSKAWRDQLKVFQKKYQGVAMAGYTHMRKAMPSSISLWAESFRESIDDTIAFLTFVKNHVDQNPLGTGAGYGVPLPLDRELTTKELGFLKTQHNPIYAQNSRGKFESLILAALSQVLFDINKMASDLLLLSMPEFGIFEIPKAFCTGSSIMPQKNNPDCLELLRGRYHILAGEEWKIKSLIGNLISGYHRDIQLTKEVLVNGFTMTLESLKMITLIIKNLRVNKVQAKASLSKELFATQKVYELVAKGIPFRKAYSQVKKSLS